MSAIERESPGVKDNNSAACPELVYRAMVPAQSIQSSTCAPTKTTFSFRLSSDPGSVSAGTACFPDFCDSAISGNPYAPDEVARKSFLRVMKAILLEIYLESPPDAPIWRRTDGPNLGLCKWLNRT